MNWNKLLTLIGTTALFAAKVLGIIGKKWYYENIKKKYKY